MFSSCSADQTQQTLSENQEEVERNEAEEMEEKEEDEEGDQHGNQPGNKYEPIRDGNVHEPFAPPYLRAATLQ